MWNLKRNDTDELTKERLTDLENKLKVACGKEQLGSLAWTCILCYYLTWITNKDLLYGTCNSVQYYVTDGWEGRLGRMDTCICMVESLPCSPQTITTLFIGYTPIQNKKFKKKRKERRKQAASSLMYIWAMMYLI